MSTSAALEKACLMMPYHLFFFSSPVRSLRRWEVIREAEQVGSEELVDVGAASDPCSGLNPPV